MCSDYLSNPTKHLPYIQIVIFKKLAYNSNSALLISMLMLPYTRDIYDGFVIKSHICHDPGWYENLVYFLKTVGIQHQGRAIKIDVAHDHGVMIPQLKQLGFDFYYGNNDFTQWVYRNNSPIPQKAIVSSLRCHVILLKDNHVLFTEQVLNHELAGQLILPGGNLNPDELPYDGGIREVKEETGLIVNNMGLIGLLTRLEVGGLKTTDVNFYYVCTNFHGAIQRQTAEIRKLVWVPLAVCAFSSEYDGLAIGKLYNTLAAYIMGASQEKYYDTHSLNVSQPGFLQLIEGGAF